MKINPFVAFSCCAAIFLSSCADRRSMAARSKPASTSSSAPTSIPSRDTPAPPALGHPTARPASDSPAIDRPALPSRRPNGGIPTWQVTYNGPLAITGANYVIIDLFEYSSSDVQRLRQAGSMPISYFSGHYEDWRPDSGDFGKRLGKIGGWKGEFYVDWKDPKNQEVMKRRLELAKAKGFGGVDIDNVDGPGGYQYFPWLLAEAKKRQLLVGLKNFVEILPQVGHQVDFFVSEASSGEELDIYRKYNKPAVRMYYNRGAPTPPFVFETTSGCDGSKF